MDIRSLCSTPAAALAAFLLSAPASAATLEGEVALDYYVAGTDSEGFESVDAAFDAAQVRNTTGSTSGPLSLEAWATTDGTPQGDGETVGALDLGYLGAGQSAYGVSGTVAADDLAPGEYSMHVLLQDARYSDWDDARTMSPTLLWRGGIEARGLSVYPDPYDRWVDVSLDQLRNNRRDGALSNGLVLTLYATHGYGPVSSGYTLCSARVAGLYAGEVAYDERFGCATDLLPDGGYTLHVEVAESGGRGGSSTVSGADVEARDGQLDASGYGCCGDSYIYAAGSGPLMLLPLLGAALGRRRAAVTISRNPARGP